MKRCRIRSHEFGRMCGSSLGCPGTFVFELGWDQDLASLGSLRTSGLFALASSSVGLSRLTA